MFPAAEISVWDAAAKWNEARNLGVVSTKPCEMASAHQNTFDRKLIILSPFLLFFHRETRLHRCHYSTERGFCGARGNFSASFTVACL